MFLLGKHYVFCNAFNVVLIMLNVIRCGNIADGQRKKCIKMAHIPILES